MIMRRFIGFLFIASLMLAGCNLIKDDPEQSTSKITLSVTPPHVNGYYLAGGDYKNPYLENGWPKSGSSFTAYLIQDGVIVSVCDVHSEEKELSEENQKKPVTVNVPVPKDFEQDKGYWVVLVDGAAKSAKKGNTIQSTIPTKRGVGYIPAWYMADGGAGFISMPSAMYLVCSECVYIKNSTSATIKVKHKGYVADEKWYYSDADVQITVNPYLTVVEGKAGSSESVSEVIEINPGETGFILSLFTPNGKKMSNARLVLEIDGKEVRTEPASSDREIENGIPYFFRVNWTGAALEWGSGN